MSPEPVEVGPNYYGHSYYAQSDRENNNNGYLDSQAEVGRGVDLLFHANDPGGQIYFQKYFRVKLEKAGWQIPDIAKTAFAAQTRTYDYMLAKNTRSSELGSVPVSVLYNVNLDEVIRRYSPGWRLKTHCESEWSLQCIMDALHISGDEAIIDEDILDAAGNLVMRLHRDQTSGNYTSIFSPLSPTSLRHALLWMPPYLQDDFEHLLGLPSQNVEDTQRFVRSQIEWEETQGKQKMSGPICLSAKDAKQKGANSVTEAVISQCQPDVSGIGFPEFGITASTSANPLIHTRFQNSCIVIMVYDRVAKKGLLLHRPTFDSTIGREKHNYILESRLDHACLMTEYMKDGKSALGLVFDNARFTARGCFGNYPLEWYASVFRNVYFRSSADKDIDVTVLSTGVTVRGAVADADIAFRRYFPKAKVREAHSPDLNMDAGVSSWLDTRNGNIYMTNTWGRSNDLQNAKLCTSFRQPIKEEIY